MAARPTEDAAAAVLRSLKLVFCCFSDSFDYLGVHNLLASYGGPILGDVISMESM